MKLKLQTEQTKVTNYLQLRNLPAVLHEAARVAAARQGISLNLFFINAIQGHVFRAAQTDKVVAAVLEEEK